MEPLIHFAEQAPVLTLVRRFAAPRVLVWRMFAEPEHLVRWWGPRGFTNPVCRLDFRVGGHWHHVMRGPDGREYPTDSTFLEIEPPERIVYRNAAPEGEVWGDNPPPSFVRTLTFIEIAKETELTLHAEFQSFEQRDAARRRGFVEGTLESYDKLAAALDAASPQK